MARIAIWILNNSVPRIPHLRMEAQILLIAFVGRVTNNSQTRTIVKSVTTLNIAGRNFGLIKGQSVRIFRARGCDKQ